MSRQAKLTDAFPIFSPFSQADRLLLLLLLASDHKSLGVSKHFASSIYTASSAVLLRTNDWVTLHIL
jgi:hypothetical protein